VLVTGSDGINFNVEVKVNPPRMSPKGHVKYFDRDVDLKFSSRDITCVTITGSHATILGTGEVSGALVSFQLDLGDNSKNGRADTFSIMLSNGYSRAGVLQDGNIKIDSCGMDFHHKDNDRDEDRNRDRDEELGLRWFALSLSEAGEPNSMKSILYDSLFRFYDNSRLRNIF
jgi:hypothetical protein